MDACRSLCGIMVPSRVMWCSVSVTAQEASEMNATTVAVDLAKNVFQLAIADERWRVIRGERLTCMQLLCRSRGESRDMEACGSGTSLGTLLRGRGI